jgi:hypothetical protein
MSEQSEPMIDWLKSIGGKRPADCRDLTDDLLREAGSPPVPAKGTTFMSMEAYSYAREVALICTDQYFEDARLERERAKAGGDFAGAELADNRAQFWARTHAWFKTTYL